jgi:phosphoribosylaminoimidazolecarboxamide formyltransferase / IMP cyclohydrolase
MPRELPLRYGLNPHQVPARVSVPDGELPFRVLAGTPGYINLLDALNAWQLVRELRAATGLPAGASFKHVSPAGAAVGTPLPDDLRRASFVEDLELSPLASAYARARGADRVSSFGDFAAMSDTLDEPTAQILKREVSDGVIAPGYKPETLEVLRQKKGGKYLVLEIDPTWEPPATERRELCGVTFEQAANRAPITPELLANVVTERRDFPAEAVRDLLVATIALKYTQSNSVCFALDGQVIGLGAGQQSRIHCTRLAAGKADLWWLRRHPRVLELPFRPGLARAEKNNAIDLYLSLDVTAAERELMAEAFTELPAPLAEDERRAWLGRLQGVSLSSDAFFPFRDNIDRAAASGVGYALQPGGSVRDDAVIEAANAYSMVMAFSGLRLFHH